MALDERGIEADATALGTWLDSEIDRIIGNLDQSIIAIAEKNATNGKALLRELIIKQIIGVTGCLSDQIAEPQQWCID